MSLTMVVAGCGASGGDGAASDDVEPASEISDSPNPGDPDPGEVVEEALPDTVDEVTATGPGVVSGTGSAVITISGTPYAFTGDYCVSTSSSFEMLGTGETDAGSFYAEITLDDAAADLDDDGAEDKTGNVSLTIGDDEAIYRATVLVTGMGDVEEFTYEIADGAATGNGQIMDLMAGGGGDLEFSAECA